MIPSKKRKQSFFLSVILTIYCLALFCPRITTGGFSWGLDDILAICFLPYFLFSLPKWVLSRGQTIFWLWVVIIIQGIICGLIFSVQNLNSIIFPTEMWQYFKRMSYFYVSANFAFGQKISTARFIRILFVSFLCAGIIGLIQALNWGNLSSMLSNLYIRSEHQLEMIIDWEFGNRRVYGVAGFSNAWGGFSVFSAAFAFAGFLLRDAAVKKRWEFSNVLLITVFFLSVFNVIFAGSRISLISLFVAVAFLLMFSTLFSWKDVAKKIPGTLFLILFTYITASIFLRERIDFFLYRFDALYVTELSNMLPGGRINQVWIALGLLNNFTSMMLGVGNATQRALGISWGTEVEPIYLLVNYGIFGTLLRYAIVALIFSYAYRIYKISTSTERFLALATMGAITGYLVFSMGYFFFQELYVGAFPWLLFGWIAGKYYLSRDWFSKKNVGDKI